MRRLLSRLSITLLAAAGVVACDPRSPRSPPTPKASDAAASVPATLPVAPRVSPVATG